MRQGRARDIAKDIIFFIITTVVAYAYWMLVFLLISFLTLSYLHFTIEGIFALAAAGTVVVDLLYVRKLVKKYRRP